MGTTVTLDALTFNDGTPDGDGVLWQMRELEGWDSPEIREDVLDRPFQHGQYRGESFHGSRLLVMRGLIRCPSLSTQRTARHTLAAATDLTSIDGLLGVQESPTKQLLVRRAGRAVIKPVGDRLLDYDIPLRAVDPRKYATAATTVSISTGATEAGTVGGTTDLWTIITLTPGGSGMTLTETVSGQSVTVSTGSAVVVNAADDTVTVSGALAWARLTAGGFITLRGGDSFSFTTSGGSASVVYTAAWM